MASVIASLDTSAEEQRRPREIIALLAQPDSRDELGIDQIRDAFSSTLFPGTSVIQTRARPKNRPTGGVSVRSPALARSHTDHARLPLLPGYLDDPRPCI